MITKERNNLGKSKKSEDEIDIVAVNDIEQTAIIAEVRRQAKHINYSLLKVKAANMLKVNPEIKDYPIDFQGLSLAEM